MRILAIEGALARCSAAVLAHGTVLAAACADAPRGQPALLPSMVQGVLARAGLAAAALDAVAVGIGPGGFTGLRAAIALAAGIAHGAGRPLVGVTTGEALLAARPGPWRAGHAIWSAIDNRRGRVVLEIFPPGADTPGAPLVAALDALPAPVGPVLVLGDAAEAVAAALRARGDDADPAPGLPDAIALAGIAAARLRAGGPVRGAAPLYAEPPAVTGPAAA